MCYIRISTWEKKLIERHKLNVSRLFRRALADKIKEMTQEYPDKDVYAYAAAWNKVSSEVCSILTEADFDVLRKSDERRLDLQRMVAPYLSPKSLEHFAIFLQGAKLSDHILVSFFTFNESRAEKNEADVSSKHSAKA
ncbi:MAG: hypothetical protein OS112_03240 [Methanoregula sp.]|nr:MAG: hypothetical protein OS112_03240 [Methanoregula sp.]